MVVTGGAEDVLKPSVADQDIDGVFLSGLNLGNTKKNEISY